jgi:hypothetical protein
MPALASDVPCAPPAWRPGCRRRPRPARRDRLAAVALDPSALASTLASAAKAGESADASAVLTAQVLTAAAAAGTVQATRAAGRGLASLGRALQALLTDGGWDGDGGKGGGGSGGGSGGSGGGGGDDDDAHPHQRAAPAFLAAGATLALMILHEDAAAATFGAASWVLLSLPVPASFELVLLALAGVHLVRTRAKTSAEA